MKIPMWLLILLAFLPFPARAFAEEGRLQVLEYKERGVVLLFDPDSRRLWECDTRSIDRANPNTRDCRPREDGPRATESGNASFISIDSEPRGAEVYVDSEYKGTTPLQNLRVTSGNVPLSVFKEGFSRQRLNLAMKPGERRDLGTIKLTNMYGQIYVNTMPPRATVTFDGERFKARTPLTIRRISRDQRHLLRLDLDGYQSWERPVDLEAKDKTKYDVQMEKDSKNSQ